MYCIGKAFLDRLYHAALKAREKALEKGDKRDPEKVIMEREELERQQREEKALLQAEANTAEDARRKAEAEVAAAARDGNDDGTDDRTALAARLATTVFVRPPSEVDRDRPSKSRARPARPHRLPSCCYSSLSATFVSCRYESAASPSRDRPSKPAPSVEVCKAEPRACLHNLSRIAT
ncbi:transcription factor GTE10-like [Cucumis melo var. makuwa]|uniref:Transcription factor GTE10-like n=1 Tax=Cucumis melo var. makuwa TaxID=1194695 RepID=A0A5D3BUD0_CUCMM|nr:transcription factor GTE10-like [Cucumis melo var. makuwa]TYK02705.1 transcription factor GTE10-like [Cucumis melo var. makuwa]